MIAVIDYDIGNLAAIANMLNRLGASCVVTADPAVVEAADRIILPGNGAFDACVRGIRSSGLLDLLTHKVLVQRTPLLGICVGAQMLGYGSEEGKEPGLGWIDMQVRRFPRLPGLRVPHMGWCHVDKGPVPSTLVQDLADDARFYFVHSYYLAPADPQAVMLRATYGIDFAAAVHQGNITGVQFHPEKSHRFGKALLAQFAQGEG